MRRALIIAEREFFAYVRTRTFWIALVLVPVILALGSGFLALAARGGSQAASGVVFVDAADGRYVAAVDRAVRAASRPDRPLTVSTRRPDGLRPTVGAELVSGPEGGVEARLSGDAAAVLALKAPLERELAAAVQQSLLEEAGVDPELARAVAGAPDVVAVKTGLDAGPSFALPLARRVGGSFLTVMLWLNLVAALGMLVQAVAQERSNRSLEILMASARPWQIVSGKLVGVAAVLATVTGVWSLFGGALAGVATLAGVEANTPVLLQRIIDSIADPMLFAAAAAISAMAYLSYGSVLVCVGVLARDFPAAENLARPFFAVLVVVLLAMMARLLTGAADPEWMLWTPVFTPFLMLAKLPEGLTAFEFAGGLAVMGAVTVVMLALSGRFFAAAMGETSKGGWFGQGLASARPA